ncbi:hypothetical protein [Nocardioides okcheonensis]|uniref:hypothetical protein n=1 Tax=Nocardioides okcheonensis TaxID=2894081 RepID=UPI001E630AD1|nr:hypothetical protein [Nocardioides okcheonensis]UFN44509.1 hypothetical protein LN652_21110 [Nocardioides okcheonensis]
MTDELDDMHVDPGRTSWWRGRASGGPLDGSEIQVEAAPFIPMRGMHLNICVGEEVNSAQWHVYAYDQRFDERLGAVGVFKHFGVLEGDPKPPRST